MQQNNSTFKKIDKPLLIMYALFLIFGWVCIYEASYVETQTSIFDLNYRSGMQFVWIGICCLAAFIIVNTKPTLFYSWSYILYVAVMALLLLTIFIAPNIKGSHSWIVIGGFSFQPAEFAKFATALALAQYFESTSSASGSTSERKLAIIGVIIALPILLILLQSETGSALVFFSMLIMLYREGLSPYVLLVGFMAILIFVLTIRFSADVSMFFTDNFGKFISIVVILCVAALIYKQYERRSSSPLRSWHVFVAVAGSVLIGVVLNLLGLKIDLLYVILVPTVLFIAALLVLFAEAYYRRYILIAVFIAGFIIYSFSAEFIFEKVLEPHQRIRIETLLGLKEDPKGAEWNTNQSKIAISSGGLFGKGFLKGTQTKLKFVPEQDTDFVFCTIAEEWGLAGSLVVLGLFFSFILRIITLSERSHSVFIRIYGYCVAGIFMFHVMINVGMVIGLLPVIGIPLPFFSYGGSSLLSFTILLFIFIKLDMSSKVNI